MDVPEGSRRLPRVELLLLAIILLGGFALRAWDLSGNPPGMFRDELEKGYTALELWKTGRHAAITAEGPAVSRFLPVFIDVFGDKTSAIYQYAAAPFAGTLGLSRATTRLPAALVGTATILLAWCLARRWHGDMMGLLAATTMAVLPGAVIFSRWAQQGVFLPLLVLGGWALWWRAMHERNAARPLAYAVAAGLCFALAFYAYDPARLVVPLFLMALVLPLGRNLWGELRVRVIAFAVSFLLIAVPVFFFAASEEGAHRFRRVSVFRDGISAGIPRAMENYAAHFSPRFLFHGGDRNPRHTLPAPWSGVASIPLALLVLTGVVACGRNILLPESPEHRARAISLIGLLLAAPAAAALTRDGIPHALRSILLVPALVMIAAEGAAMIPKVTCPTRRRALWIGAALLIASSAVLSTIGVRRLKSHRPDVWQFGVLELTQALHERLEVDKPAGFAISAEIPYAPYYLLFVEQPHPREFQRLGMQSVKGLIAPPGVRAAALPAGLLLLGPDPSHPPFADSDPLPIITVVRNGALHRVTDAGRLLDE